MEPAPPGVDTMEEPECMLRTASTTSVHQVHAFRQTLRPIRIFRIALLLPP